VRACSIDFHFNRFVNGPFFASAVDFNRRNPAPLCFTSSRDCKWL